MEFIPFRLLKLPILTVEQILKSMEPSDLFMATFFDSKLKRLAFGMNWKSNYHMVVRLQWLPFVSIKAGINYSLVAWEKMNDEEGMQVRKVNGRLIQTRLLFPVFRPPKVRPVPFIQFPSNEEDWISKEIQLHVHKLFKANDVRFSGYAEWFGPIQLAFPAYIAHVTKDGRITAEALDAFLDANPVEKKIIVSPHIDGEPRYDSKLWKIYSIHLSHSPWLTVDHVKLFQGRYASLNAPAWNERHFIEFLQGWIRGEHNVDIDMLNVCGMEVYDAAVVRRELNPQVYNPERRNAAYIWPDDRNLFLTSPVDLSRARDIRRETDGMLASITFSEQRFCMYVWKDSVPVAAE